ncbi:MAG: hypothetical protein K2Y22_12080 [Candidatus Obscuribacterales bacterium]|nr:hypothetical protein [Candidatus Obscuribacterales bacterium]
MLDLRLIIGAIFIIFGTLLVIFGYASPTTTEIGASSINLNITWGSVMGLFGIVMCMLAKIKPDTQ